MYKTYKNKDTWCRVLGDFRSRIKFNPEIIRRVVALVVLYTFRNPNGNRYVLYLYRNDSGKWNWNYNWLDNNWDANNFSVGSATLLILLLFVEGVLFIELPLPATKHFTDFANFFRKCQIFIITE